MKQLNKKLILIYFCVVSIIGFGFSNTEMPSISLANINLKQQAIENVQLSVLNKGSANDYLNKAISALKQAINQTSPDNKELLQLGLSLFSLQIDIKDYKQAGQTLDMLMENFPDNPIVQIYDSAYSYIFDFSNYRKSLAVLQKSTWIEMPVYLNAFNIINRSFHLHINMDVDELEIDRNANILIVILGSPLNTDGSMDKLLTKRLEKGLAAYKKYPNSKILVTGGRVKSGTTESYQMMKWLMNNKVPADHIILEDLSSNLVWQTMNTYALIKDIEPKITDIIVVTSSADVRRAIAVFRQESFDNNMLDIKIDNLATEARGYNITAPLEDYEKVTIIKDTLRAAGIWLMPGMVF